MSNKPNLRIIQAIYMYKHEKIVNYWQYIKCSRTQNVEESTHIRYWKTNKCKKDIRLLTMDNG